MNATKLLIVLLVVAAVVLGALVVLRNTNIVQWLDTPVSSTKTAVTSVPASQSATTPTLPGLTAEERKILTPPAPGEEKAYSELLYKNAKIADHLSLGGNCVGDPIVIRIAAGSSIMVKNADSRNHTISFGTQHTLDVPAGASKTLATDFLKANMAYGYECDAMSGTAGLVLVSAK